MSIFIGNDTGDVPIVHMTSSAVPEVGLKGGVLSSTIFHSSLPYLQQLSYEVLPHYDFDTWSGQSWYASRSVKLSAPIIDFILAGYEFIVIVNTVNAGNVNIGLPAMSYFIKTGAPHVVQDTSSRSGNVYGPSSNPSTWETADFTDTPSYTNCYLSLYNPMSLEDGILLTSSSTTYGPRDIVNSVSVLVFDMDQSGVIKTNTSTQYINISNSEFTIESGQYGAIDLNNFKALRKVSTPTSSSYRLSGGTVNISTYSSNVTSPVTWSIDSFDSSNPIISKKGSNNVIETVISKSLQNFVNYDSFDVNYTVGCSKNTWGYYSTGVSLPTNHLVCITNNGTFDNGYYIGAPTYGKVQFLGEGGSIVISRGYTYRSSNGSEYFADYYLYVYIENSVLKVRAYAKNPTGQSVDAGTFAGTLSLSFFSYS